MEISQTARVCVQYGDTLAFGLCNDFGELNERIGLFPCYEDLESYCRKNGIHCVDLEPEEKDILTVYQYEQQQGIPEYKRLTFAQEWGGEDGRPAYTFQTYASDRIMAELAHLVRYGAVDDETKSLLYGREGPRLYDGRAEWDRHMDRLSQQQMEAYRQMYPDGTRIELAYMEEPYNPVPAGMRGTVQSVDDRGNIHVVWDNGRCFPLVPNMDAFRMLCSRELCQEKEEQEAWLEAANRNLAPFEFRYRYGLYCLSLPPVPKEESPFWISRNEDGLDYGTGYVWTRIFTEFFCNHPGFPQITLAPDWERFCATSKNPRLLESMGNELKKLWENTAEFRGIADRVQSRIHEEITMCF